MSDHDEMARAFDFEIGSWHVSHRRLRERLAGCQEWDSFTGTADMRPVLGGNGNIEDNFLNLPQGAYRAIAIRSYDPRRGLWAIWWLSTTDPLSIETPVMGRFEGEVGTFYADDCFKGRPVKTRFLWLDTHTASPRWEQAMSADGGESWETNWTMDFKRAEAGAGAGEFVVASGTGAA